MNLELVFIFTTIILGRLIVSYIYTDTCTRTEIIQNGDLFYIILEHAKGMYALHGSLLHIIFFFEISDSNLSIIYDFGIRIFNLDCLLIKI